MTTNFGHNPPSASREELLAVAQRLEGLLVAQTKILERLTIAEVESTHRDKLLAQLGQDVAALRNQQQANTILIAKASGAAGLAGIALPYVVKALMGA